MIVNGYNNDGRDEYHDQSNRKNDAGNRDAFFPNDSKFFLFRPSAFLFQSALFREDAALFFLFFLFAVPFFETLTQAVYLFVGVAETANVLQFINGC